MAEITSRDIEYSHDGTRMLGMLCAPADASNVSHLPTVLLVHDAFGLSDHMTRIAHQIAGLGFAVFAADVWGERTLPAAEPEIGPLIGSMVADRPRWMARIAAAHEAAAAQPEVDPARMAGLGYCFGGSSVLEYVRIGGDLRGVVAIHPGLDLVEFDWSQAAAGTLALVSLGADDPMATPDQWRQSKVGMTEAGVDWELNLYSGTVHAFTSPNAANSPKPELILYHPRNAARANARTEHFLTELFGDAFDSSATNTPPHSAVQR